MDAVDLAIAIVLEQVDTSCLTLTGALLAIPPNFLFKGGKDEGVGRGRLRHGTLY
ncbi:hypothetical protein [Streptomyces sp. NPDC005322]|uniref:hypothetical protein n=1 Tax=Streptomyces sp. NPDC005322 TaxID=3157032 RepID=UPI0033A4FDC0